MTRLRHADPKPTTQRLPSPKLTAQPRLLRQLLRDPQPALDELAETAGPVCGFWTGNLQLSEPADRPDLHPVRNQQITMTRYWYLWLGAAAVLFAVGWLPLIFDDPDNASDFSFGGWYVWVLTWLGAIITGGIGVILAGLRLTIRHRMRLA